MFVTSADFHLSMQRAWNNTPLISVGPNLAHVIFSGRALLAISLLINNWGRRKVKLCMCPNLSPNALHNMPTGKEAQVYNNIQKCWKGGNSGFRGCGGVETPPFGSCLRQQQGFFKSANQVTIPIGWAGTQLCVCLPEGKHWKCSCAKTEAGLPCFNRIA